MNRRGFLTGLGATIAGAMTGVSVPALASRKWGHYERGIDRVYVEIGNEGWNPGYAFTYTQRIMVPRDVTEQFDLILERRDEILTRRFRERYESFWLHGEETVEDVRGLMKPERFFEGKPMLMAG